MSEVRPVDANALKENMMIAFDCENATKYGNKDAEQQAHSYSTLMLYEIANIVEDCIDNAPTVDCIEFNRATEAIIAHERIAYERGVADGYAEALEDIADMKGGAE